MEKPKIKDYYKKKEDGSQEFDESAYDTAMQSYIDDQRRIASETAKKNGIAEGKKQAEETAKMSAEEKLEQTKKEFQEEMDKKLAEFKEKEIAFNKERIKAIYKNGGLSEKEIETLVSLVGEDYEGSLKSANDFIEARKSVLETYKNDLMKDIQGGQPDPKGNNGGSGAKDSVAQQYAKQYNESQQSEKPITWGNYQKN